MGENSKNFGKIIDKNESRSRLLTSYKFTWIIYNFKSLSRSVEYFDESPHFFSGVNKECEWSLDIFLFGYDQNSYDYIGIRAYLFDQSRHQNANFIFKCSILDENGKNHSTKLAEVVRSVGAVQQFISRKDLLSKPNLLPNDQLSIECEIFDLSNKHIKVDKDINDILLSQNSPLQNFKRLLDDEKFSDFKLIVKEKEFRVHRAILATQSPVFEAMFDSKMREANEGEVHIEDIELKVMEKLLHFIYTGKVDVEDSADKILVAAEKYQLDSLKWRCENVLAKKLSVDNVYDMLKIADQNSAAYLKEKAIELFDNNLKTLREAENFKASVNSLSGDLKTEIICIRALNDK